MKSARLSRSLFQRTFLAQGTVSRIAAFSAKIDKDWEYFIVEKNVETAVTVVTINRPSALNALCNGLIAEMGEIFSELEKDDETRAVVMTGTGKAFCAGGDIKEVVEKTFTSVNQKDFVAGFDFFRYLNKPLVAAINGLAFGGGFQIAQMFDILIAGESAKFCEPESRIGTIPGAGGTQRLPRTIGKSRAMEMIFAADIMGADEAAQRGLVSRVVPDEQLLEEAKTVAGKIASYSQPVVKAAKECVKMADELTLRDGLLFERRQFYATFATRDRKEGMNAFVEKRKPEWHHE